MLVMLTPSLACAMPVCADKVQAAAIEQPCAGHGGHHESGEEPAGKLALLKDCMGVDLQVADNLTAIKSLDFAKDAPFDIGKVVYPAKKLIASGVFGNRGPPPDWPQLSQVQPPILLTTQRLRI